MASGDEFNPGTDDRRPWTHWNNAYYTTGNATTNVQTWGNWNQIYYQQTAVTFNQLNYALQPPDPQVQIAEEAEKKRRVAAQRRAEEFLLENLSPAQRESYRTHGLFIVETPKKVRYKLHKAHTPRRLEGEKEVTSYCIHTYGVPREDELLGFKLLLEANE